MNNNMTYRNVPQDWIDAKRSTVDWYNHLWFVRHYASLGENVVPEIIKNSISSQQEIEHILEQLARIPKHLWVSHSAYQELQKWYTRRERESWMATGEFTLDEIQTAEEMINGDNT